MAFNVPNVADVSNLLSNYTKIVFHKQGGFKAVYFGDVDGVKETIKLVFISDVNLPETEKNKEVAEENTKRALRELNILKTCRSRFIVKLGQFIPREVVLSNLRFVAYTEEYLDGNDLHSLVQDQYRPAENELRYLGSCLLQAVKELWFIAKVVHRDIKPLNIMKMRDSARGFVLLDLGIAFSPTETSLTHNPLNIPGSLIYLAPEYFSANFREKLDYRSDLYTIGLTLYEFAASINPFARQGDAAGQTVSRILKQKPQALRELRPDLSSEFCDLVNFLLKKIPALRPSNLDKLISFMEGNR